MTFHVLVTRTAKRMLAEIADRRIREKIGERIDGLRAEPERQGKPLQGELEGYRSLRAVGQRYCIIFRVERRQVVVYVLAIGIRKEGGRRDIYALARKLLRQRLIER
jgi:mRNA interferase RelE/StbE